MSINDVYGTMAYTAYDRKKAAIYWENIRKETLKIREAYDAHYENKYNDKFISKCKETLMYYRILDLQQRPEFLEPYKKITKKYKP